MDSLPNAKKNERGAIFRENAIGWFVTKPPSVQKAKISVAAFLESGQNLPLKSTKYLLREST